MSSIIGLPAEDWIEQTHPQNGLFRVYWTEVNEVASFEDTGFGLRYEWYYKDGKKADGISKGWWRNGQLKHTWTWKNGKENGLYTYWFENGQKRREVIFKNGKRHGLYTSWYEKNGQKKEEGWYKYGEKDGKWIRWYDDGNEKGKYIGNLRFPMAKKKSKNTGI